MTDDWDDEFGEDYWAALLESDDESDSSSITVVACNLENPDICESCQ